MCGLRCATDRHTHTPTTILRKDESPEWELSFWDNWSADERIDKSNNW